MNLSTGRSKLHGSLEDLRLHWEEIKIIWNDPVRKEFEEKFWVDLEETVLTAIRGIDRLDQIVRQAQNECS